MGMKVYLSAGHNVTKGRGNGAVSCYGDEAVIAAEIRGRIALGIPTLYVDSDAMKLSEVVSDVNRRIGRNGMAVELHFNAAADPSANGAECVVANNAGSMSKRRAAEISALVSEVLGVRNRGVKSEAQSGRTRLAFVRDTVCPAVIVEVCFITNREDMEKFGAKKGELIEKLTEYFKAL